MESHKHMNRKEQLQKELEEITRQEELAKEQSERLDLINRKIYTPLATGTIVQDIWNISEYTFQELSEGFYTVGQLLGSPDYKKGDKVVLINTENYGKYWFPIQENNDYFYIDENECGIPEVESDLVDNIIDL